MAEDLKEPVKIQVHGWRSHDFLKGDWEKGGELQDHGLVF